MRDTTKGIISAVFSALALSSMGILGKKLFLNGVDPLNVVMLRAVVAFLTLGAVLFIVKGRLPRIHPKDIWLFVVLGFIGISLNYSAFFIALDLTTVSTAIMLLYTYPVFVVIGAVLFMGEDLTNKKILALILSIMGCVFITEAHDVESLALNIWGVFFGLSASITKAIYTLLGKRALATYDPWTTTCYAFGVGAFFLSLYVVPTGVGSIALSLNSWLLIFAIAWIPTLIGYSLFVYALKYLEAGRASLIATLEPVAAVLLAAILLQESVTYAQGVGMILVISGIFVLNISYQKK